MPVTNDQLAMALVDAASNVAMTIGDTAERRVLEATAKACAQAVAAEVSRVALKDGSTRQQLLGRLLPRPLLLAVKDAPAPEPMTPAFKQAVAALGLPADWAPKVTALRDLLGEESALVALRAATKAARPAPGLTSILDGAAQSIQATMAHGWTPQNMED
jgi:hypothetical protein